MSTMQTAIAQTVAAAMLRGYDEDEVSVSLYRAPDPECRAMVAVVDWPDGAELHIPFEHSEPIGEDDLAAIAKLEADFTNMLFQAGVDRLEQLVAHQLRETLWTRHKPA